MPVLTSSERATTSALTFKTAFDTSLATYFSHIFDSRPKVLDVKSRIYLQVQESVPVVRGKLTREAKGQQMGLA